MNRRNVPTQEPKRGIQIWSNDKWSLRERKREREREREREKGEQREKGRDQGFTMPVPNHFIDQKEACLAGWGLSVVLHRTLPCMLVLAPKQPTGPVLSSLHGYVPTCWGRPGSVEWIGVASPLFFFVHYPLVNLTTVPEPVKDLLLSFPYPPLLCNCSGKAHRRTSPTNQRCSGARPCSSFGACMTALPLPKRNLNTWRMKGLSGRPPGPGLFLQSSGDWRPWCDYRALKRRNHPWPLPHSPTFKTTFQLSGCTVFLRLTSSGPSTKSPCIRT